MHRLALGVAICGLAFTSGATAADIAVVPTKLIVVDKLTKAGKAKAVYVAKDTLATKGAGLDVEQISVRLDVAYGNGNAVGAFVVPAGTASGWLVNKESVAKYVNKDAPGGPTEAKVAVIKPEKLLKLVGKGLGDTDVDVLSAGDPGGPVYTAYCVTNGGEESCHCSEFTGCLWKSIAGDTGAKLVCKTGAGDASCEAVPPTPCQDGDGICPPGCGLANDDDCPSCFADLGLTVLDTCTNLEWEKKDTPVNSGADEPNLHDVDNRYSWAGKCTLATDVHCQPNPEAAATCAAATGGALGCEECGVGNGTCNVNPVGLDTITTIWDWINQVNAAGFAGHSDWRLPSESGCNSCFMGDPVFSCSSCDAHELETLLPDPYPCGTSPCIDPVFGSTWPSFYWSSSTADLLPTTAWYLYFQNGGVGNQDKQAFAHVRAVREAP